MGRSRKRRGRRKSGEEGGLRDEGMCTFGRRGEAAGGGAGGV